MEPISFRSRLLSAALGATLILAGGACSQGAKSEEDQAVGEGAAALTSSEENGDNGAGDAVALNSDTELDARTGEEADAAQAPPETAGDVCDFSATRAKILQEFDANGNGKLDPSELAALRDDLNAALHPRLARLGWRLRAFAFLSIRWAFDENGDHQLESDERTAMSDALEARCERRHAAALAEFDTDHDGKLDATELAAERAAYRAKLQAKYDAILAQYDVNHNGVLDPAERLKYREDLLAAARAHRLQLMEQYDTNHDGVLSTAEALPLRKEIQNRIINGPTDQ
jgi:Ca2+-binding EF-hand superfamily protein